MVSADFNAMSKLLPWGCVPYTMELEGIDDKSLGCASVDRSYDISPVWRDDMASPKPRKTAGRNIE